jgi:Lipopolysaccharide kinase (Kdo/WaaP) family
MPRSSLQAGSYQPSMLTKQVIRDGLSYFLTGGLWLRKAHLPVAGHAIADDFIGVCVATQEDSAVDDYVITQLHALGVRRVRLDFSYGDLEGVNARFLDALIAANFRINLHLVQPFDSAKHMLLPAEQLVWQKFIINVLDRFGPHLQHIEVGSTINRKRWCGYTFDGFLAAWDIAYRQIKARNLTIVGPNVQDFEPFYNVSILKHLKVRQQLPDIVSNNLFCERVPEPESLDHRVFKYQWTTWFHYNLIKKARLLQKISQDFGVASVISPVAFWSIFRVQRRYPDALQKQADYAARYFLLLAASGALTQVNWGALICQREGLITDGLTEHDYPALERVTHYKQADGHVEHYAHQPSFDAVKTCAHYVQGARYVRAISTLNGLEIHHFESDGQTLHVLWTQNGRVAFLSALYDDNALAQASLVGRDGHRLPNTHAFVTESPIYLAWQNNPIKVAVSPVLAKDLIIHAHQTEQQYFRFNEDGWQGLILAKDAQEAALIKQYLHPAQLQAPQKEGALRHARNAIWAISDPRNPTQQLTVKQPVKMYPHKAFLDRFKPSKAKRSWNGAMELQRRGIGTASPVAFFEKVGDTSLKQNFYVCEYVESVANIGQIFAAFAQGETTFKHLQTEEVYFQFAQFCHNMHGRLVYFRDFSGGNILVNFNARQQLTFSLIDTARLRTYSITPFPEQYRLADMTRACHKLHWAGRERLMQIYFGMMGRPFTWRHRLAFHLYDFKVRLKKTIGRKGWKRIIKKLKGKHA